MYFNYLYLSFLETIKYRIPTSHTGVGTLSFFIPFYDISVCKDKYYYSKCQVFS